MSLLHHFLDVQQALLHHQSTLDILLAISPVAELTGTSGIGLETCILFAKEGANILMADISAPALEKASAKLRQLVPSAHKVEIQVILSSAYSCTH
jgi:NADP-dependent 3-hydroxy acid dehydrogenase YdfG